MGAAAPYGMREPTGHEGHLPGNIKYSFGKALALNGFLFFLCTSGALPSTNRTRIGVLPEQHGVSKLGCSKSQNFSVSQQPVKALNIKKTRGWDEETKDGMRKMQALNLTSSDFQAWIGEPSCESALMV